MKKLKKLSLARTAIALVLALLTTTTAWADVRYNCTIEVSLNPPYDNSVGITDIEVDGVNYGNNSPIEIELVSGAKTIQVSFRYGYEIIDEQGGWNEVDSSERDYFDVPTTVGSSVTVSNSYFNATIRCDGIIKGGSIESCNFTVPDQTLEGPDNPFENITYKFEYANSNYSESYAAEFIREMGVVVKDGDYTLALGTDYTFGGVTYADGDPITESAFGDECKVEIVGIGDYAGSKWVEFMVTTPDADGTWGDLAWSFHAGTLTISKKDDVEGNVTMDATTQGSYPWFSNAAYIKTITLGEGITSIAASAFAGTSNENSYSNLAKLNLPTTLTTIGENAFAFCTSLTVDLDDILAKNIEIGNNAFNLIGCLKGTVSDNADNADKMALLSQANGDITLSGRTLYKDGNWNTLCLPFDVADGDDTDELTFTGTPLEGATVKELKTSETNFKDGTLSLSFKDATKIDAGKPYLIMWASGDDLVNPKFTNVKIISIDPATDVTSIDDYVTFKGTYAPVTFGSANKSILFLGDDNTLYWPDGNEVTTINAFRAYFQLTDLTLAGKVRNIVLNLDGEASGIEALTADAEASSAAWYTLSGVKLQGKPTDRGLYLHGKQKVFVP